MTTHRVRTSVTVEIDCKDESVWRRCVENHDDAGVPQPDLLRHSNGTGWRDYFYDLRTKDAVFEHLAFNALANGVLYASRLDGWADLPEDACEMRVDTNSFDVEEVYEA